VRFDPFVDIDWDAPENAFGQERSALAAGSGCLSARGLRIGYAEQPLERRIDMGRWITANTLKVTLQFEMMLVRGVVHYAGKLPNGSRGVRYLLPRNWRTNVITSRCSRNSSTAPARMFPGMRRGSRIFGPVLGFIGGYASIFHFIGVLCGEQPLHYQQTLPGIVVGSGAPAAE